MSKYAVFQKVGIEDRSDDFARIALYGEGATLPPLDSEESLLLPGESESSGDALVPAGVLETAIRALENAGARELAEEDAEALRIEAGRPEWGRDVDATNFVDEAGLADAVSTTKGCYVGQEIVARLRTYGRVNRRLVGFLFPEGLLPPGAPLGRPAEAEPARVEAGRVTSSAVSRRLGAIGLGYAFHDVAIGDRLVASPGEAGASAIVAALPLASA